MAVALRGEFGMLLHVIGYGYSAQIYSNVSIVSSRKAVGSGAAPSTRQELSSLGSLYFIGVAGVCVVGLCRGFSVGFGRCRAVDDGIGRARRRVGGRWAQRGRLGSGL